MLQCCINFITDLHHMKQERPKSYLFWSSRQGVRFNKSDMHYLSLGCCLLLSMEQVRHDTSELTRHLGACPTLFELPEVASYRRISLQRGDSQLPAAGFGRVWFSRLVLESRHLETCLLSPQVDYGRAVTGECLTAPPSFILISNNFFLF